MPATKFNTSFQGYDPATIYEVNQANKTLSPYTSGQAYTGAGYQFGQESLGDINAYSSYKVGSPVVYTPPQTNNIPVSQMGNTQALQLPKTSTDTSDADGLVAGTQNATKSIADYVKELTPTATDASKKAGSLTSSIEELLGKSSGQTGALIEAENTAGLPQLKTQLADINAQLLSRSAQYDLTAQKLEDQAIPMSQIIGQQAQVRKAQASEIGLLQARALGLQGQVEAAQDVARRAVELKYAPILDEIDVKMKQLALIQPMLDKEESRFADALRLKLEDDRVKAEEEKTKSKMNLSLALEAGISTPLVNRGGEWYRTSDGKAYSSPAELFADYPELQGDFNNAYKKGLVTDYTQERIADREFAAQARSTYWDAGILVTDNPDVVSQKIQASRIFKQETRLASGTGGSSGGSGSSRGSVAGNTTNLSPEAQAVISGTLRLEDLTPTVRGKIAGELTDAGYQTGPKLSAGQQQDIAEMATISDMIDKVLNYNSDGNLEGVGAVSGGLGNLLTRTFGSGSQEAKDVRALVGNIKGTIAKLRGGTSFTENEQKLLESYTPSINEHGKSVVNKLNLLKEFITSKKFNTINSAVDRGVTNNNDPLGVR
jgi:hypothetical protein